jgi:transcription elongation factor Elf1
MKRTYKARGRCAGCKDKLIVTCTTLTDKREVQGELDRGVYRCGACEEKYR